MKKRVDYEWVKPYNVVTSEYCKPDEIMYVYQPTPTQTQTVIYPIYPSTAATTQTTICNVEVQGWYDALTGSAGLGLGSLGSLAEAQSGYQYRTATAAAMGQYQCNYQYINGLGGLWGYSGLCQAPETAQEKAARLKRAEEVEARRKAASLRAEHLLFTILTPSQVKSYTDDDFIELVVKDRVYRIRKGYSRNVELIEAGKPTVRYCAHPADAYKTPVPDAMLAQLLMIQNNEVEFLKVANRTVLQ